MLAGFNGRRFIGRIVVAMSRRRDLRGFRLNGLSNELISGAHEAFTAIPIVKDASRRRRANPIPSDTVIPTKLLGALQDGCVINANHLNASP